MLNVKTAAVAAVMVVAAGAGVSACGAQADAADGTRGLTLGRSVALPVPAELVGEFGMPNSRVVVDVLQSPRAGEPLVVRYSGKDGAVASFEVAADLSSARALPAGQGLTAGNSVGRLAPTSTGWRALSGDVPDALDGQQVAAMAAIADDVEDASGGKVFAVVEGTPRLYEATRTTP